MKEGDRVELITTVSIHWLGEFEPGITGTICDLVEDEDETEETGLLFSVEMDEKIPELEPWENKLQVGLASHGWVSTPTAFKLIPPSTP